MTAPFTLAQNSCGGSLAGGASCSAQVVFTPTTNGTAAGTLTIGSSLNAATVILSGTGGVAGAVQLQPGSLSFPANGRGHGQQRSGYYGGQHRAGIADGSCAHGLKRLSNREQHLHERAGAGRHLHGRSDVCACGRGPADRQLYRLRVRLWRPACKQPFQGWGLTSRLRLRDRRARRSQAVRLRVTLCSLTPMGGSTGDIHIPMRLAACEHGLHVQPGRRDHRREFHRYSDRPDCDGPFVDISAQFGAAPAGLRFLWSAGLCCSRWRADAGEGHSSGQYWPFSW